jgi:hypothetical protein
MLADRGPRLPGDRRSAAESRERRGYGTQHAPSVVRTGRYECRAGCANGAIPAWSTRPADGTFNCRLKRPLQFQQARNQTTGEINSPKWRHWE